MSRRDDRQRRGARLRPRIPRPGSRRTDGVGARGRGRDRKVDDLACGVEAARERGMCVLVSRPAELDRGLAHAGLGDVFDKVLEQVLPSCRRRGGARSRWRCCSKTHPRLRSTDARRRSPKRLGGSRCKGAGRAGRRRRPVARSVVGERLTFALRRMGEQPVHVLLARRTGERAETLGARVRIRDRPSRAAARRPSHARCRSSLLQRTPRPARSRAQRWCACTRCPAGTRFTRSRSPRQSARTSTPRSRFLFQGRWRDCARPHRRAAGANTRGAAARRGRGPSVRRALRKPERREHVLDPAVAARVIERTDGTIRFTHPLLASVVYQACRRTNGGARTDDRPGRRGSARPRPPPRAFDGGPDTEIAAALEDAAALASDRGAPIVAAELAEHALRLTPPDAHSDRHRRALTAARAHQAPASGRVRERSHRSARRRREPVPGAPRRLSSLPSSRASTRSASLLEEALREAASRRRFGR